MKFQISKRKKWKDESNYITLFRRIKHPVLIEEINDDEGSIRKLGAVKRILAVSGSVLALILAVMAVNNYLIPYMKSKDSQDTEVITAHFQNEDGEAGVSQPEEYLPVAYDENTGLPVYDDDFNLFIINPEFTATKKYVPETKKYGDIEVHENIVAALRSMVSDAEKDGIELVFDNGYISYEKQKEMYSKEVERLEKSGYTHLMAGHSAKDRVPYPGESDFQTGLDVRIKADAETFTDSDVYIWLNRNAADYGFVFRYPQGKKDYTGRKEDYTVIRYVGNENAVKMRQLSMCLEEYESYVYSR